MVETKNSCDGGKLPGSSSSGAGKMQTEILLIMEENTWRDMIKVGNEER